MIYDSDKYMFSIGSKTAFKILLPIKVERVEIYLWGYI